MKRLKFKKPFNGMDNAKKLIPESYKVDGNEFEITDGNETYRVKWSSLINEGIILTSSNKGQINEDMNKIKHLMGFKSQDTLGTVKGADRLDENKKFGDVLDKTKNLLNEEANENLELKSLAKKFIPIIKKYKMGVEYKTDTKSIEAKPDNVNQTPPAKLIVHNDGILTVAVYFLSLSRSLNELDYEGGPSEQDYEKAKSQAGNMYKELIAVIPEGEFDLRSRPEPNKYGWYIMQFKKKGGDKDIKPGKSVSENEHIKSGMGGSNKGKSKSLISEGEVKTHAMTNAIKDIHPSDEYFLVAYFKDTNSLKFLGWGDMNEMNDWVQINVGFYNKKNTILYRGDDFEDAEEAYNKYKLLSINLNEYNKNKEEIEEGEHIKSGMGGSNKGKSRTDKTEVLKKNSKKGRRNADKEATKDADKEATKNINEDDVANFQDALGSNPKVANAAKKLNTPIEKIEAAVKFINNIAGDDDALIGKIIRAIKKDDSDVVNELENSELADLNKDGELSSYEEKRGSAIEKAMEAPVDETYEDDYYDFDDTTTSIEGEPGYNQSDINPIDTDLLSQIDPTNTKAGREAKKYGQDDVRKDTSQPKKGIHPLDPRKHALPYDLDSYGPDDLPTPPSEEEEQAAQVYEDRFDEVFEGMYEDEDLEESKFSYNPEKDYDDEGYQNYKKEKNPYSHTGPGSDYYEPEQPEQEFPQDVKYSKLRDKEYIQNFNKKLDDALKSNGVGYHDGYHPQKEVIDQFVSDNNFDEEDMSLKDDFLRGVWRGYD